MQNLPTPFLGEITALTITTPDLEISLAYYQQLGFKLVMRAEWPFPWIQLSDGVLLIMLRKDPKPYLALTYYVKNIDKVAKCLEKKGVSFVQKPKKTDAVQRYLITSPDGLNISLVGMIDGFKQPPGPGMLQMNQQDYFNPEKYINKTSGLFGELAHPVQDLAASIEYWQLLGFQAVSKFTTPYRWAILSDGLAVVGLHQTNKFSYPAITYFAADMQKKIDDLIKAGLKGYELENSSNAVLTTPEQQHIFLYKLGGMGEGDDSAKKEIQTNLIETERLLLKELNPDVLKELYTSFPDDYIMKFLGLTSEEELEKEKNKWRGGLGTYRSTYKRFLLVEKTTGKVIGSGGFHNWYPDHMRAELGYAMTDETAKQKGYMKEAMAEAVKFGFEQMGLNRIEAFVGPGNEASQRIVGGLGFTKEGTLREHFYHNGTMDDSICFALLKSEYQKR